MAKTMTLTGGCLCGAVRYEWRGTEVSASYCHCDDCRRATGGPYTVGVGVDAAALTVTGTVKGYTTRGDSGRPITRQFCPECGAPLFTRADSVPDGVWIKAGSLDEPQRVCPTVQIWTQCAVPWAYLDKALPGYPQGGPPTD